MAKKPAPFNNPFGGLKLKKDEPKKPVSTPPPASRAPTPSANRGQSKAQANAGDDEAAMFRLAVGSVDQVKKGPGLVSGGPPPTDAIRIQSEDDEVLEHLALLVGGEGEFDLADSDEFIEGAISGLDR